jgi:molecular chaperone DnaK
MSSNNNPAVGIDFGTTNTVVGVQTDAMGSTILEIPQPVEDRIHFEKQGQIKSCVYFESETHSTVGAFAASQLESFRSIKSHMGTRWRARHPNTGNLLRPSYIAAHILKLAFQTIEAEFSGWDGTALITVPASFNTDQRNDTITAAKLAGFSDLRLLDEPTAAFYYFFNQHRDSGDFDEIRRILVFDFGGGTLDVSIINIETDDDTIVLDTIGRSRYNNLGGDDIDLDLTAFFLACWEFENDTEIAKFPTFLRSNFYKLFIDKSRMYKEEVEDYLFNDQGMPEFVINEEVFGEDKSLTVQLRRMLTQSQYEEITSRYLKSKSDLNICRPINEAIKVAKSIKPSFSPDQLDLILYTGGASNMGSVQSALKAHFAPKKCFSISMEEACNTVAFGAAPCRYDELYGSTKVRMTNRLLESIFTRQSGEKRYTTIVPLTCEPSEHFEKVGAQFKLHRPAIGLRLPLFRGVSSVDHQLAPMRDLEISVNEILDKNITYDIFFRMTENKTVELKVVFHTKGGAVESIAKLDLFTERTEDKSSLPLCEINSV